MMLLPRLGKRSKTAKVWECSLQQLQRARAAFPRDLVERALARRFVTVAHSFVPWRKRPPVKWSSLDPTMRAGANGSF
jgi:hypothetical protein